MPLAQSFGSRFYEALRGGCRWSNDRGALNSSRPTWKVGLRCPSRASRLECLFFAPSTLPKIGRKAIAGKPDDLESRTLLGSRPLFCRPDFARNRHVRQILNGDVCQIRCVSVRIFVDRPLLHRG